MAGLTPKQLAALNSTVAQSGSVDLDKLVGHMIRRGQLPPFYDHLMARSPPSTTSLQGSTRTAKMLEVVNVVKRSSSPATYVHLYESMSLVAGVHSESAETLASQLPSDYMAANRMPEVRACFAIDAPACRRRRRRSRDLDEHAPTSHMCHSNRDLRPFTGDPPKMNT